MIGYIRKQDAIDDLHTQLMYRMGSDDMKRRLDDWVKALPSAQPERKKGEWIPEFDGKFTGGTYWFSCSKCKRIVPEVRNGGWNFCPNCGAKMDGGENG